MAKVLVIDDDLEICLMLCDLVNVIGHAAEYAQTLRQGIDTVFSDSVDVVLLDVKMPDGNGLEGLKTIRSTRNPPEVIIITGVGDPDGAELAIRNGAWDYIQKPLSPRKIMLPLKRVLRYSDSIKQKDTTFHDFQKLGIIGESSRIRSCLDAINAAASGDANVTIFGETGTGKEKCARALHAKSQRSRHDFVVVDCASLTETLAKSTLFGHEKGSFTGADRSTTGLIKQADGGTLFLDEVGELSPEIQKTFLRVLQEHRFRPVGARQEQTSNFRLISATHRNLDEMVESGLFRQDLMYRLSAITIEVPPLREREGDIELLANHYLNHFCRKYNTPAKKLSVDLLEALHIYSWPGNIRELINAVEAAINNGKSESQLCTQHLPKPIRIYAARSAFDSQSNLEGMNLSQTDAANFPPFKEYRDEIRTSAERQYLTRLMEISRGKIKEACQISQLGRTHLYSLLKKYNISKDGWPD